MKGLPHNGAGHRCQQTNEVVFARILGDDATVEANGRRANLHKTFICKFYQPMPIRLA